MNIVLVCHTDFANNSGIQMFHLANALTDIGCDCICVVPSNKETADYCGTPKFAVRDAAEALSHGLAFANARPPALIHAWTPREPVRKTSESLAKRFSAPTIVHLEDNENLLTADRIGIEPAEMMRLSDAELDRRIPCYASHPRRSRAFLERSIGVTALVEKLCELAPEDIPSQVFYPSCDESLFHPMPPDADLRAELGIGEGEIVLTYNGNVHETNWGEVRSLYLSVLFLNRMGCRARFIRLGSGIDCLGSAGNAVAPYVIDLGKRPNREMPRYLSLATALVQPGRAGAFNDYRFPSKIPEFLAMQRPIVLPRSNIGLQMKDGENCLLLKQGHAGEIVDRVLTLWRDPALADRLAKGGRRFFEANLSWEQSARVVLAFYRRLLASRLLQSDTAGNPGQATRGAELGAATTIQSGTDTD